jgi:protein-tyrosine-phosphatase
MEMEKELKVTKKKSARRQITSLQVSSSDSILCFSSHKKHLCSLTFPNQFHTAVFKS